MKQFYAISFLFIFLSANTAFGELLKLPLLIQHYTEHKQDETAISFIHFLAEHYTGKVTNRSISVAPKAGATVMTCT